MYGYKFSLQSAYSPIASHSGEVAFVFGNLVPQSFAPKVPAAGSEDRKVSDTLMSYWVNFAKSGNPNGPDLPVWPEFRSDRSLLQVQEDGSFKASPPSPEQIARFKFLDKEDSLISASSGNP